MIKYQLLLTRGVTMTEVQDDILIIVRGIWPHSSQGLPEDIKWTKMLISALQIYQTPSNLPQSCTATTALAWQPEDCTAKCQHVEVAALHCWEILALEALSKLLIPSQGNGLGGN